MKLTIKTIAGVILALSVIAVCPPSAHGVTIDFEAGLVGNAIGGFYVGLGATFANASFVNNYSVAGSSGFQGLGDITDPSNPPFSPVPSNPIKITFSSPISAFSIVACDVGAAGARIDAYDSLVGGLLVGFDQLIGAGAGVGTFTTLAVSSPSILRIELYQPVAAPGDGMLFDQATFEAVPEPTITALVGLGVAALFLRRSTIRLQTS